MTSSRPYRKTPLTHEQAVDQLEKFAGIQFDPDIVPILVNLDREHPRSAARPRRRAADDAPPSGPDADAPQRRGMPPDGPGEARVWPRTMFLSTILLALIVGALAGGALPAARAT